MDPAIVDPALDPRLAGDRSGGILRSDVPCPKDLRASLLSGTPPTLVGHQDIYTYNIKSRDTLPAPQQAAWDCFRNLPPFPKDTKRNDAAWLPYLTAMGLTRGIYPAISIPGYRPQKTTPSSGGTEVCWNYIIYILIAMSPCGKLELHVIYNLALAWCPTLTAQNASCRHALTTQQAFRGEENGWRLSWESELLKATKTRKEVERGGDERAEIKDPEDRLTSSASTNALKRGQKRKLVETKDVEYEGQGNSRPNPRRASSRKCTKTPKYQDNAESQDEVNDGVSPETTSGQRGNATLKTTTLERIRKLQHKSNDIPDSKTSASRKCTRRTSKSEVQNHNEAEPPIAPSQRRARSNIKGKDSANNDDIEFERSSLSATPPPTTTRSGRRTKATEKARQVAEDTSTTPRKASPCRKRRASPAVHADNLPLLPEPTTTEDEAPIQQGLSYEDSADKAEDFPPAQGSPDAPSPKPRRRGGAKPRPKVMDEGPVPLEDRPAWARSLRTKRTSSAASRRARSAAPPPATASSPRGSIAAYSARAPVTTTWQEPVVVEMEFHKAYVPGADDRPTRPTVEETIADFVNEERTSARERRDRMEYFDAESGEGGWMERRRRDMSVHVWELGYRTLRGQDAVPWYEQPAAYFDGRECGVRVR